MGQVVEGIERESLKGRNVISLDYLISETYYFKNGVLNNSKTKA